METPSLACRPLPDSAQTQFDCGRSYDLDKERATYREAGELATVYGEKAEAGYSTRGDQHCKLVIWHSMMPRGGAIATRRAPPGRALAGQMIRR